MAVMIAGLAQPARKSRPTASTAGDVRVVTKSTWEYSQNVRMEVISKRMSRQDVA